MSKHKNLVVDVNNALWKLRYTQKLNPRKKESFVPQLLFILFLQDINDLFRKFKCDGVLCAFEGKGNWRKKVYAEYKMRAEEDIYYEDVQETIAMLREFFEEHTSIASISVPHMEADDVIAVACQEKSDDVEHIIISSDKDFIQLLKNPGVSLYSPQQDVFRESEDPDFYLFVKCIRGDASDNIHSAYPRVRTTKLEEAFRGDDPIAMINLMKHKNKDGRTVEEVYKFNRMLIDLTQQPENLRENTLAALRTPPSGKYHQGKVMKWGRENKVEKLIEDAMSGKFTKLFNSRFSM